MQALPKTLLRSGEDQRSVIYFSHQLVQCFASMSEKRIYFAADEKLIGALCEPLRKTGLSVETFERQADVVDAVRSDVPDVLLLGARLPDGSALAAFKALEPMVPPTVVILNPSQLATRMGLLRAGISDIFVSPLRPRVLASRLAELGGGIRRVEGRERTLIPVLIDLDGRHVRGTTVDISREGLGLRLDDGLTEHMVVGVSVQPPAGSSLKLYGRVAHSRFEGEQAFVGVRLLGVSPEEEATLLQIAQTHPPLEEAAPKEPTPAPRPAPGRQDVERVQRKPVKVLAAKPSRWPEGVYSLLEAIDALRHGVGVTAELVAAQQPMPESLPSSWVAERPQIEVDALRFSLGLTQLERRAFEPEPEIVVVLDDAEPLPRYPRPIKPSLEPGLATLLCLGAANRFRASQVEEVGRALIGPEGRTSSRGLRNVAIDDAALDELLTSLRRWMLEAQSFVQEADLSGDKELASTLRSLQDASMQQASTLAEVRVLARDAAAKLANSMAAAKASQPRGESPRAGAGRSG